MIIFYNKSTGKVAGLIEGRLHSPEDNSLWIGSKEENDRLVFTWRKRDDGNFEPDVDDLDQKAILIAIDKKPSIVYDFSIRSRKLVKE